MKICFIAPKAYTLFNPKVKSGFGGSEVQLNLLANELAKNDELNINFMVADYGQKEIEIHSKIYVWKSLDFNKSTLKQVWDFCYTFNRINADIYVLSSMSPIAGLISFYCKLINKKFFFMIANDGETDKSHKVYGKVFSRILSNLVFKCSTYIVVQNTYQQKCLWKYEGKNSIIIKPASYMRTHVSKNRDSILWVGRLDKGFKRPEFFIRLSESFPEQNFLMIALPATNQLDYFHHVEKQASYRKNIEFIPFVPFNDTDKHFRKAKIFINTSVQEGFPNTFVQAAKNKVPILSLKVNPDNFLDGIECGFSCDDNFNLLKEKLSKLLTDKKLFESMSESVYAYGRKNLDIAINAKRFLDLIKAA
ncbi:MAG: glycosyltransferase [archaeon]